MRVRGSVVMLVGVLFSLISGGCAGGDPGAPVSIQVADNAFLPSTLTVKAGTTVSWTWNGLNPHNVLFAASTGIPSSSIQTNGGFEAQFTAPGTYAYICSLHLSMNGTIIVQ